MEITWHGQSCFRLRDRGWALVTDPYGPESGLALPRLSATIVTVSHDHQDHNYVRGVRGRPYAVTGPGEYEIGGVFVIGVPIHRNGRDGAQEGWNTAYLIEYDDLAVCHLGHLAQVPTQEQVEQLGDVDILLVPVGGHSTLSGARAAEVVGLLDPKIVIPMQYKIPGLDAALESPRRFLREMGIDEPERTESLKTTKSQLPEETCVVLLEPKSQ